MLFLIFPYQILHCSCNVFDWYFRVHTVLIEQVDCINPESFKRSLGNLFDVLRPTIKTKPLRPPAGIKFEAELGSYHHLPSKGREGFAHEFFVSERSVNFGGIEECDPTFNG